MQSGIYAIKNTTNGKSYVGSAVNLERRLKHHRSRLRNGHHKNRHLQSAWNLYGETAFEFSTLLHCSRDNLMFYEQRAIDAYDAVTTGYNIDPTAGKTIGRAVNPERIAKMAATKRGKPHTQESRAAIREAMNRPDVRAKLSASCKAAVRKPKTAEHIRNAALAQRGKIVSPETRAKLAAALLGKKRGPHILKQKTRSSKGRPLAPEHVAKLREAWQRRKQRLATAA